MLTTDIPLDTFWTKLCTKAGNTDKDCSLRKMSLAELVEIIGDGKCAYTGREFKSLQDITFERVNPKLGYVKGNVLLVNHDSNLQKGWLDNFMHKPFIPDAMKIKLLRKAIYQLEKGNGKNTETP